MPGPENKQADHYQFTATETLVPEYEYSVVKKHNLQKKPEQDPSYYVEVPATRAKKVSDPNFKPTMYFILAAIAELYRAIGPKNGAPKYRVRTDENGVVISLLSKVVEDFYGLTQQEASYRNALDDILIPAAAHFALIYLFEELDLNPNNIDIDQNIRIDFDLTFVDFFKRIALANNFANTFSGKPCRRNFFSVHPVDLNIYPNMVVAKPWNLLFFRKASYPLHVAQLNRGSDSPEFNKIVHQYFLKSFLFNKALLRPILTAHIADNEDVNDFETYIDERFNAIKIALVQVPKFRKNVIEHFEEYKANILDEIKAHNQQFENRKNPDRQQYYAGRVINLDDVTKKLDQLHYMINACEIAAKNNNQFAAFRKQVALAADDVNFNDKKLLNLLYKQIGALYQHFEVCKDFEFEQVLSQYLEHVFAQIDNKHITSPDSIAEILFYADKHISECLIKQERNLRPLQRKDAVNFLIKAYAEDVINGVSALAGFEYLPLEWQRSEEITYFKQVIQALKTKSITDMVNELAIESYETKVNVLCQFSEAQTAAKQNNIKILIGNLNSFDKLYEVIQDDNLAAIEYEQYFNFSDPIVLKQDFYNTLLKLLDDCVDYADLIDDQGVAILYREHVNSLYGFLEEGISEQHPPENIVANIMNAIKNSSAEFSEHRGIKGLFDALKDLIYQLICFDSSATTKPWISTKRVALLEKVNEACAVVQPRLDR
ncbi:MAG: hypothetical protein WC748_07305 [Legionellales bacterium]|jgi:hypothetical protein